MSSIARFLLAATVAFTAAAFGADEARRTEPSSERKPAESKRVWEWNLEERLNVRFDPARIAQRELERESLSSAQSVSPHGDPAAATAGVITIDGRRHPELLLPHELFEALITGFLPDAEERERQREAYRAGIESFGYDASLFWARLNSVASQYIDYQYGTATPKSRDELAVCRAAYNALAAARQAFDPETFDQFLYQVVAPGTWLSLATNANDPSARLRRIAKGCL